MKTIENQTVARDHCGVRLGPEERHNIFHVTRNVIVEDLALINCELIGEGLVTYGAPVHRSTARNVRITNCRVNGFAGIGAVFEDVVVDGLRTSRMPVILDGCAFRHVVLRGELGRFLINPNVSHDEKVRTQAFHSANASFYETVDWALDISEAKASCIEIRGAIPARLIRRNLDEHFIMTREIAEQQLWRHHTPFGAFEIAVSTFLASGAEQNVFVAARRSRHFKAEVEFFRRLRVAGLVS